MDKQTDIAISPGIPLEMASHLARFWSVAIAEREVSQGARVYVCTIEDVVDAMMISCMPASVGLIAVAGINTSGIDLHAARTKGIKVSNTPCHSNNTALSLTANIAAFFDRGLPLSRV